MNININKINNVQKLIRKHVFDVDPYVPVVPIEVLAEKYGISLHKVIKLDANENPYGCSQRIIQAIADYKYYNIYPDTAHIQLRSILEKYVGVEAKNIVFGSGSDELIDLILRLFIEPGDKVINCIPTFGMYSFSTAVNGGKVISLKRNEDYSIDISKVVKSIDDRTKLIFIATPNNPTGNVTPREDIITLIKSEIIVVIDEAYYEFCGITVADLVNKYQNLIVLRTFSKWAGLAGLRVGYALINSKILEYFNRIRPPYSVNAAAIVAVKEALADLDTIKAQIQLIITERERLFNKLQQVKFLEPYSSKSNFILCKVIGENARDLKEKLARQGIFIRYFDTPLLQNMIRISVGKPEHTDRLLEAISMLEKK